ncbi:MAG: hypothetical protein IJZ09_00525 [Tidjanibacter sp.]|nr:hypothetical protein [Tidjanibacter sp.]
MTTKISAIIAQYIAAQTRLIIPEVGTLIRRKESGEIVFMEMLRKSDGVLAGLVVNTLDVSPSKGSEIVNAYSATIKQQLATNKKFVIDGVGVLLARHDGGTDFSFNPFAQSIPEPSRGVEILEEDAEVPPMPKPLAPAKPVAPAEPVAPAMPKVVVSAPKVEVAAPKTAPKPATQPTPKPTIQAEPQPRKVIYRTEEEDEVLDRKSRIQPHQTRKKIDGITIAAFVALLLALLSLIWGAIPSGDRVEVNVEPTEVVVNE